MSKSIHKIIAEYITETFLSSNHYRIIIPGLTKKFSESLQKEFFKEQGKNSFLTKIDGTADKEKNWIHPSACTSNREKNAIFIFSPGELSFVQEGIKSTTGGTANSIWDENFPLSGEHLDKFENILNKLWDYLGIQEKEWELLNHLITIGINQSLNEGQTLEGLNILFDQILHDFSDEKKNREISTIFSSTRFNTNYIKFCYSTNLPLTTSTITTTSDVENYITDLYELYTAIDKKVQNSSFLSLKEEFIDNIENKINDIDSKNYLKEFIDELILNEDSSFGILKYQSLFKRIKEAYSNDTVKLMKILEAFSIENLKILLNVKDKIDSDLELKNIEIIGNGISTSGFKKVIITKDSFLRANIRYKTNLSSQQLEEGSLELKISGPSIENYEYTEISSAASDYTFNKIKLLDDHKLFKKNTNIKVSLRYKKDGKYKNLNEVSFNLYVAHEKESNSIVILKGRNTEKTEIFPLHTIEEDDADEFKINDDVELIIISDISEPNLEIRYDNKIIDYNIQKKDDEDVIYSLKYPIQNEIVSDNLLSIISDNHNYYKKLEFDVNIKGEFSVEDALFNCVSNVKKPSDLNALHRIFEGRTTPIEAYKKLGNIDNLDCMLRLSNYLEDENRGHLPFLVKNGFKQLSVQEEYINFDESDIGELKTNFKNILLSEEALKLLENYSACRFEFIHFISSKFDNSSLLRKHPKYCQFPYFINCFSTEIEEILATYLKSYKEIQDFVNSQDPNTHDQMILSNLDKIILIDEISNDPTLYIFNPWHPIVVYNRYFVQKNLYYFTDALKNDWDDKYCFSETVKLLRNSLNNEIIRSYDILSGRMEDFKLSKLNLSPWVISSKINEQILDNTYSQLYNSLSFRLIQNDGGNKNFLNVIKNFKKTYPHKNSFSICFDDKNSISYDVIKSFTEDEILEKNINQIHVLSEGYSIDKMTEDCEEILEKKGKNLFIYSSSWKKDLKKDILVSRESTMPKYNKELSNKPLLKSYGRDECSIYSKNNKAINNNGNKYRSITSFKTENNLNNNSSIGRLYNEIRNKEKFKIEIEQDEVLPSDTQKNFRWLYMPSKNLDASALILYLKNHESSFNLWDFNFDFFSSSSYFIVSEAIPSLSKQIKEYFNSVDDIIRELGLNGISLSNDIFKNTNAFKGAMGLACAFKSFKDSGYFKNSLEDKELTFTIPVDSFKGVFANKSNTVDSQKFSDIIAINLKILDEKLFIKAYVIEAKFRTNAMDTTFYEEVQKQLKATKKRLDLLISNSLKSSGIPERLVLLELISFGLRTQYDTHKESAFLRFESEVYQKILNNSFIHNYTKTQLVSLEYEKSITTCEPAIQSESDLNDSHSKSIILTYNKDHNPFTKSDLYKASINYAQRLDGTDTTADSTDGIDTTSNSIDDADTTADSTDGTDTTGNSIDDVDTTADSTDGTDTTGNSIDDADTTADSIDGTTLEDDGNRDPAETRYQIPNTTIGVFQDDRSKAELNIKSCANKNVLVCGSSGKGKTSLLKYLVHKYVKYHESCFIFDVVSNDFSKDEAFTKENNLIQINVKNDGLPFNPLIPKASNINGEQVYNIKEHSMKLSKALAFACDFLSNHTHTTLLFDLINEVYEDSGIKISKKSKIPNSNYQFPTFASVMEKLKAISRSNGSDKRSADLLRSRLLDIDNDEILDNQINSIGTLLDEKRYLINLTGLDNKTIALCLSVFLTFAENYFASENAVTYSKTCIVIDEAHRLGKLETLSKYARECRKWGVSMILSSQGIDDFTDVYKDNSSTKICHSMETEPSNKKILELLMPRSSEQFDDTLNHFGNFKDFEVLAKCEGLELKPIFTIGWHHYLLYKHLIKNGKCKIDELHNIKGYKLPLEPSRRIEQLKKDLNHLLRLKALKEYPTENTVEAIEGALS